MVLGEVEKLYDKMVKDLVNAIMGDITSTNRSISPPPLPVRNCDRWGAVYGLSF
jgi:hypothetical protein